MIYIVEPLIVYCQLPIIVLLLISLMNSRQDTTTAGHVLGSAVSYVDDLWGALVPGGRLELLLEQGRRMLPHAGDFLVVLQAALGVHMSHATHKHTHNIIIRTWVFYCNTKRPCTWVGPNFNYAWQLIQLLFIITCKRKH